MSHTKKILIINADDYGMSLPVNRGILKAAEGGLLRATTVMTNSLDFDAAMDELFRSGMNMDIGFHANLTWGQPVSNPEEIRSLVNEEGMFFQNTKLLGMSLLGMISVDDAHRELKAQFERLLHRSKTISHIDGHHHIHAFPCIREAIVKIAAEFKVPYIRAPYEGKWSPLNWAGLRRVVVSLLCASKPAFWKGRGFSTADNFGGFALGAGNKMRERWLQTISRIPAGVTEIMVHPGHFSSNGDKYNTGREEEIKMLNDPALVEAVKTNGVEVVSFRDLI